VKSSPGLTYYWLMPLGGLLLALSFPNDIIPGPLGDRPPAWLAWLALLPLMWGVLTLPAKAARRGAWLYAAAFYLGTLSWMRLFGVVPWVLLAGYLSLTPWLALHLAQRMPERRWLLPLGFALAWSGLEWLRGQGLFGFHWSEVGASQVDGFSAHLAAIGGVPLLSFLLLWVTGTVMWQMVDRPPSRRVLVIALTVLVICLCAGEWQTHATQARWQRQPATLHLSLVQPNSLRGLTPEDLLVPNTPEEIERWERKVQARVDALTTLSYQAAAARHREAQTDHEPHLLIWPESALPDPPLQHFEISTLGWRTGSEILVGAPCLDYLPNGNEECLRNAAYLMSPGGGILARYDKMHLVPFGEFVPLRSFVSKYYIVRPDDIRPGEKRATIPLGSHRVGVAICFESTFPSIAREYARLGAQALVIITNDAWFHQTCAVRQHLNHARFRAIETGLPVARVAGTGISAFIAPDGRLLDAIPTYTAGTRTRSIPPGVPGTVYSRIGWLFGPFCLGMSLVLAILGIILRRRRVSTKATS